MQMTMTSEQLCACGNPMREYADEAEPLCAVCERRKRRYVEVHYHALVERFQAMTREFDPQPPYIPNAEEIREQCLKIQEGWSEKDFRRRTGRIGQKHMTTKVSKVRLSQSFFDGEED